MSLAVGYIVIGRNEGEKLSACLRSLPTERTALIYADSGSSDDSIAVAKAAGADIVQAEGAPLTAARGRNAGLQRLLATAPQAQVAMFVDGDSTLEPGWPQAAAAFLAGRPDVAVVSGAVSERHPERTVYNRLCDIEWQAPPGETTTCGGIAMMRLSALRDAGGFNPDLRGGEEPELCLRMREAGWKIWRLAAPMAQHDAAIGTFAQWFKRMRRGGRAFAEISWMHRKSPARIWHRETARAMAWTALLPAAIAGSMIHPAALMLLSVYPLQVARLAMRRGKLAPKARDFAWTYAFFITLAKFAEAAGVLEFAISRRFNSPARKSAMIGATKANEQGG